MGKTEREREREREKERKLANRGVGCRPNYLKALGVQAAGVVRGRLQFAVHCLHEVLRVPDVLQVSVGPQI